MPSALTLNSPEFLPIHLVHSSQDGAAAYAVLQADKQMGLIEWNVSYSVGVAAMDMQHQKWCGIINRLHDAMMAGKANHIQKSILGEVVEYARMHFKGEEMLLQTKGYPELQKQTREHEEFMVRVDDLQAKVASGAVVLTVDVMDFLKNWLAHHILVEDKKYGAWFVAARRS